MTILFSKTITRSATVLAVSLIAAGPTLSFAADEKILPGSICQPTSVDISGARMFYSGGSVVNFTNEDNGIQVARLHCPLVRDHVTKSWKKIYVRVRDNSSQASVDCTATNYNAYAGNFINVSQTSGQSFVGLKSLPFDRPSSDYDYGSFHVYCSLPGNTSGGDFSAIHSIRLVEE